MIKDLVVNLAIGSARDAARDYAISIARDFSANLAGIAFNYEPTFPGAFINGVATGIIEEQRVENRNAAAIAIERFDEVSRQAGISSESHVVDGSFGAAAVQFGQMARRFNLSVVAQSKPGKGTPEDLLIEGALFESGRPVVIVPYIQKAALKLDRVLVCWDGSRSAARAAADALPFLERAKNVTVLTVLNNDSRLEEPMGADIAGHLARHCRKVEARQDVFDGLDVANAILSCAADSASDLIVMGGHGHSRLREFVLGGVTRGMLGAMTVPTLMSH